MREIKFRGIRVDNNEWVYGGYVIGKSGNHYIFQGNDGQENVEDDCCLIHRDSVGQFTGLTDKNGKEIYEGDVVIRSGKDNCIIEWRSDKCKYDFKYKVDLMSPQWMGGIDNHYSKNELEVIGNIHVETEVQNEK